jgi:sugar phosphate isomerase/epimerase
MQLKLYKALWGMTGSLEEQFDRIAAAGYVGIEAGVTGQGPDLRRLLDERNLGYIGMLFTDQPGPLADGLKHAVDLGADFVNVHSGRDWMSFDEGCAYFEGALAAEQKAGIKVVHETHRGRLLYAPWSTAAYLKKFPELKLAADFSHFTCVCESMLHGQEEDVALCVKHSHHIHGRVGYEEGPQVSDPRAPEHAGYVARFEEFWDAIRQAHKDRGESAITFDPEFGPPGYMQTLPYTRQPVADLWDVCLWMAERIKARWA